jgi:hypothetical protein
MHDKQTPKQTLEAVIRREHGALRGALRTRKNHPTYGVTKASLLERLHRLEGLCLAWASLYSEDGTASIPMVADRVLWVVDEVDYSALVAQVRSA